MPSYRFTCDSCARPFDAASAAALTCSQACRQRRYAERQAAKAVAAATLLARQAELLSRIEAEGIDAVATDLAELQRDARIALAA